MSVLSASLGLADYPEVDMLSSRYKPVNFGAERSPGSPIKPGRVGSEFRVEGLGLSGFEFRVQG